MTATCVGCGEDTEPIDLADPARGSLLAHRSGCAVAPGKPVCECYDTATMEYGTVPCAACKGGA